MIQNTKLGVQEVPQSQSPANLQHEEEEHTQRYNILTSAESTLTTFCHLSLRAQSLTELNVRNPDSHFPLAPRIHSN